LALKGDESGLKRGGEFMLRLSKTLSKTPLKKKEEEEEEGGSQGDVFGANRKIGTQNQHKLSFRFFLSFIFFNFS